MDRTIYAEYAELELELKALTEKKEELRERILEEIKSSGAEKVETDVGKFVMATKVTWTYPEKVTKLEERLKLAKVDSQKRGTAKATEKNYLTFFSKQNES